MGKLNEFFESKTYKDAGFGKGLPQGDTFFELAKLNIEPVEKDFDGKKRTSYSLKEEGSNEEFFVPISVVKNIEGVYRKAVFPFVRVTRTGTGLKDTFYTVLGVSRK